MFRRTYAAVTVALISCAACSDDAPLDPDAADAIDAAVDAIDSGARCGADFFLTGEFTDWDSTTTSFDGVEFATWTVRGEPTRTVMTNPNGRVELCIAAGATSVISITQAEYVESIYVADPTVFQAPGLFFFQTKGIKVARAPAFYASLGSLGSFDATRGHVLVQKQGAAIPLALSLGGTAFAVDGSDDLSWTAGDAGGLVLFANVPLTAATATLTSTTAFVGPSTLPVEAGKLTITTIR